MAKGGSIQTRDVDLRTAMRIEMPPFDAQSRQPTRLSSVGFRPVLSTVVTTSLQRTEMFQRDFEKESQSRTAEGADARRLAAFIKTNASDTATRDAAERLDAALQTEERKRRDLELSALRAQIEGAMYQAFLIFVRGRTLNAAVGITDEKTRQQLDRAIQALRQEIASITSGYTSSLAQIARAEASAVNGEIENTVSNLERAGTVQFVPFARLVGAHAVAARANSLPSGEALRRQIVEAGPALPISGPP